MKDSTPTKKKIEKLDLKTEIYVKNPNILEVHKKIAEKLKNQKQLDDEVFFYKTSCGSERIPERNIDYYIIAASLLFKTIEKPLSLNKLRKKNARMKKNRVAPPKRHFSSRSLTKKLIEYLESLKLVQKKQKGFCANYKAKQLYRTI